MCDVVKQYRQFEWFTRIKHIPHVTGEAREIAMRKLYNHLHGKRVDSSKGSLYYHGTYIETPSWAKKLEVVKVHGKHVFYRNRRKG